LLPDADEKQIAVPKRRSLGMDPLPRGQNPPGELQSGMARQRVDVACPDVPGEKAQIEEKDDEQANRDPLGRRFNLS
jgi:hypothetical protein